MKKKLCALLLIVALLLNLTGCGLLRRGRELLKHTRTQESAQETDRDTADNDHDILGDLESFFDSTEAVEAPEPPAYSDLVYERPDPEELRHAADAVTRELAQDDYDAALDNLEHFYELYWDYYGMYTIAIIESDADVENETMWEEYVYCTDISWDVDAIIDNMLTACAQSDYRDDLEDDFFGEGTLDSFLVEGTSNPELEELYDQEMDLVEEYLQLHGEMSQHPGGEAFYELFAPEAARIYMELIRVRNAQAEVLGYESYAQMMYDDTCYDYTVDDLMQYYQDLQTYFVPIYRQLWDDGSYDALDPTPIRAEKAFELTCQVLLDNNVACISDTLDLMMEGGYYNVDDSPNKRDTTYAIYIDSVDMPYLFLYPCGNISDCLSIAHELGHCDDMKLNYDTTYSTDISETLSQGMEYLFLCQEDVPYHDELLHYKLMEALDSNLYTASLSMFEQLAYELPEEELTPERLHQLYAQVSQEFGMYDEPEASDESWIYVDHVFQFPFYVSSYSIADTAAFSFYLMEQEETLSGELAYMDLQWDAPDYAFLEVLERAGIPSPFADGQVELQAATIAQILSE